MYYANMSKAVKRFIDEVGGLRTLLSKCDVFSFDGGRQLNILFLTAHKHKYEKYKKTHKDNELLHQPDPEDDNKELPLDFDKIFPKHPDYKAKQLSKNNNKKQQPEISKTIYSVKHTKDNELYESNFSVYTISNNSNNSTNTTKKESNNSSNKKEKKNKNSVIKVLKDKLSENISEMNTYKKKKCAECNAAVIDNFLCKCVCEHTYNQVYVSDDDKCDDFLWSRPPHNKDDNDERPKIEDVTDEDIETYDNSDSCVVNVGIQTGTQAGTAMEDRKRNENLIETNRKLFAEVKSLRVANEKLSEDLKKEKHKHTMAAEQHRNEKADFKKEKEV